MKKRMEALLKNQGDNETTEEHEEENRIILAIIIAIIGCILMTILSIVIILYKKSCQSRIPEGDVDVESTTSTYLQYSTTGSDYDYRARIEDYQYQDSYPEENDYVDIDDYFQ